MLAKAITVRHRNYGIPVQPYEKPCQIALKVYQIGVQFIPNDGTGSAGVIRASLVQKVSRSINGVHHDARSTENSRVNDVSYQSECQLLAER